MLAAVVIAAALLFSGIALGSSPAGRDAIAALMPSQIEDLILGRDERTFPLQDEVLRKLRMSFYEPVDPAILQDDAVEGMLRGLNDDYTSYLDPKDYTTFQEHAGGSYSGVGMTVEMQEGFVTVVSTFKGSPADEVGLRPGDVILEVDGEDVVGLSLDDVVGRIKGTEGTSVDLQVYHLPDGRSIEPSEDGTPALLPDGGEVEDYTVMRKTIDIPVVETEIVEAGDKRVAHIRFFTFSEGSSARLRAAIEQAIDDDQVDAVVLDLRSNGGGLLDEAVDVASIFIPSGVIVTTEGLHSPRDVYEAGGGAISKDEPVYVLVDEFSASASEIVAGALKDTDRATLVGETTFGKGLVQTIEPLSNGGALRVTTAVYLTPSGTNINEKGIAPDLEAPDDQATPDVDETLQKVLDLIREKG